jgi:TonB family protein
VKAPVDVTVLRSGVPDTVPGRVVDLSAGGIAAVLARELLPGESVGLEIELPDSSRLRIRALVRYHDKLRCGMEFVGLSPDQETAIQNFVKSPKAELEVPIKPPPEKAFREIRAEEPKKPSSPVGAPQSGESRTAGLRDRGPRYGESQPRQSKNTESKNAESKSTESKIVGEQPRSSRQVAAQTSRAAPSASRVRGWVFLIASLGILFGVLWWRWDRGWQDLESGLHAATVESPETQISADVMQGLVTHRVDPEYPEAARAANLQGVVVVDIIIGRDGSVLNVKPISGPEIFTQPAADALRWWRFRPYRINGQAVAVESTVAVEFKP